MSAIIIFAAVLAFLALSGLSMLVVGMMTAPLGAEDRFGFHLLEKPSTKRAKRIGG